MLKPYRPPSLQSLRLCVASLLLSSGQTSGSAPSISVDGDTPSFSEKIWGGDPAEGL